MEHLEITLYFVNQVPKHFQLRWNNENKPLNTALPLGNWKRTQKCSARRTSQACHIFISVSI